MEGSFPEVKERIFESSSIKYLIENQKNMTLERGVEEFIIDMTNDFIQSLVSNSAELAQHRKAENVEGQDLNFVLENIWKMHAYRSEEGRLNQKKGFSETHPMHEARMNNIKKLQQPPEKKKGPKKM